LALSDRVTGALLLEASVSVPSLLAAIDRVRDADDPDDRSCCIAVTDPDGVTAQFDARTLLVYDEDGSLSRGESLIPHGVEL
jgi:hypothetical protein